MKKHTFLQTTLFPSLLFSFFVGVFWFFGTLPTDFPESKRIYLIFGASCFLVSFIILPIMWWHRGRALSWKDLRVGVYYEIELRSYANNATYLLLTRGNFGWARWCKFPRPNKAVENCYKVMLLKKRKEVPKEVIYGAMYIEDLEGLERPICLQVPSVRSTQIDYRR